MKTGYSLIISFLLIAAILGEVDVASGQLKIMPLGDSITDGVMLMESGIVTSFQDEKNELPVLSPNGNSGVLLSSTGGYRVRLGQLLNDMGWDFDFVGRQHDVGGDHEGYPGYMTTDILYILSAALNANPPDVVLLHIGTNDLPWPINPDNCYANINLIIDGIHAFNPNAKVILAQIIPCLQNTDEAKKRYPAIIELNNLLAQIPQQKSDVTLVDMWHAFVQTTNWETELMSSTYHPNSKGYRLMADVWSAGLDQAISGRSPYITQVTPVTALFNDISFQCTIQGDYFQNGASVSLKRETGFQFDATSVNYVSANRLTATFDLTNGYEGNWLVRVKNPNNMWSIKSQNFYVSVFTDTLVPEYCVRLNAGGTAHTDSWGRPWVADKAYGSGSFGYVGGSTYSTADPIEWTNDDQLYKTERYGLTAYRFDVPNGGYRVILHFAEIYNTTANSRVFTVNIEDNVLANYDIYAEVGHDVATQKAYSVNVKDGQLNIEFVVIKDSPKISAIEVMSYHEEAILAVSPTTLNFDSTQTIKSFTIQNAGTDTLKWRAVETPEQSWITSVSPATGNLLKQELTTVSVIVDRSGNSAGNYAGTLNIYSNVDTQSVAIEMKVPAIAAFSVTPAVLPFDSTQSTMVFTIQNTGGKVLHWNALENPDQSWITSVNPANGTLPIGSSANVTVAVNRSGLTKGNYQGLIKVTSNGGENSVSVNMIVTELPVLAVSPTTLNFEHDQTTLSFNISNNGGSTLQWQACELPEKTWITAINPASGSLAKGGSATVSVTVDRSGMANGSYPGVVNVTSNSGSQYVNVFMTVQPTPPVLTVTPTMLDFDSIATSLTFKVKNSGGGTLSWQVAENPEQSWITSLTPHSGDLTSNQEISVTVTVNRYGIAIGEYNGKLLVTSNATNAELNVHINIHKLIYYIQRVDCGGGADYRDHEGNVWSADRAYSTGAYGYVGGYVNSTTSEIANTDNDALFQYVRNNSTCYKFDVVNGAYDVYLLFAEIYYNSPGLRVFGVALENVQVLTNFDIFNLAGRNTAYQRNFVVDVNDGQLNIDFIKTGEEPSISAIIVATKGIISGIEYQDESQHQSRLPESCVLYQNYPNPFTSLTRIEYDLPFAADVKITIYNMLGQQVNEVSLGHRVAGRHEFMLNALDHQGAPLPSGIYVYHIEASGIVSSGKESIIMSRKMIVKK